MTWEGKNKSTRTCPWAPLWRHLKLWDNHFIAIWFSLEVLHPRMDKFIWVAWHSELVLRCCARRKEISPDENKAVSQGNWDTGRWWYPRGRAWRHCGKSSRQGQGWEQSCRWGGGESYTVLWALALSCCFVISWANEYGLGLRGKIGILITSFYNYWFTSITFSRMHF